MDYDEYEDLMAHTMMNFASIHLNEVEIKKKIVNHFNVNIDFEENYRDMKMIIPESIKDMHPILMKIREFDWVYVSKHTDGNIVFLNIKSTEF